MRHLFFVIAAILLTHCATDRLTAPAIDLTPDQVTLLDSLATKDVPEGAPGIATAVISGGELIYDRYAGFASLEDSTLIGADTRFNLASNGKQFTALAILLLEEEGKLRRSDNIDRYLPDALLNISADITIEHLLRHTSGLRDVYDLWSLKGITWWQQTYDNNDVMALVKAQQDLNFEPGSEYRYSNTNYMLLAEIVARASGQSFVEYTSAMFDRLGMAQTAFEADHTAIDGPIAKPYLNFGSWSGYDWLWDAVGDGNFFSTMADQITWERTLQGRGDTDIPEAVLRRSQQLDSLTGTARYGYGVEFGEYEGSPYRFHEGATGAWKATVVRFEEPDVAVVTMTNSGKSIPSMQTRQMVDVLLGIENAPATYRTEPKAGGSYVSEEDVMGVYLAPSNFSFEFRKNDEGAFVLNRVGRGDVELERESDNVFRQKYDPAFKQAFYRNDDGDMVVTAYYTTHAPYSLTRPDNDWTDYRYEALEGTYTNPETGVTWSIAHDADKRYTITTNNRENPGTLVTPTKMLVSGYAIEFGPEPSSFVLSGDRIQRVRFDRQ